MTKKAECSDVCSLSHSTLQTMLAGLLQLSRPGITSDAGDRRDKLPAGAPSG
uniref:Potassium calcium-activated channel subfamily U member 1 n=1 Tax=Microcebus murinus TaxID=30608 RepID=A0A8C5VFF2_MICMU